MDRRWSIAAALALAAPMLGGCGDDGSCIPMNPSFDNGSCGDHINFTGEFVDWDNDAVNCGIANALFQVQGDGAMDLTSPNGRFEGICLPDQPVTLLDVTPSTGNSTCSGSPYPASPYPLPGIAVAHRDVIRAGAFYSFRTFTAARRDSVFAAAGFSFAPALAQVLVHVHGTPRPVSLAAAHAPPQAVAMGATTWAPGDTGHDVYFPNVDPGAGSTTLSVPGCAIGTGTIPLASGKFTYVTVFAQ